MRAASAIEPSTWVAPTPPSSWSTPNSNMVASMETSSQQPPSLTEPGPSTTPAHTAESSTPHDGSVKSDCSHPEAVPSTSTASAGACSGDSQSPSAHSAQSDSAQSNGNGNNLAGAFSRRIRCSFRIPLKVAQRLKRIASTQPHTLRRIGVNALRIANNEDVAIAEGPSKLEQMRLKQQQEREQQKTGSNSDEPFEALERVASMNSSSTTPNGVAPTPAPLSSGGRSSSDPRANSSSLSSHDAPQPPAAPPPPPHLHHPPNAPGAPQPGPPSMISSHPHPLQRAGSVCNNNSSPLLVNLLSSQQQHVNAMNAANAGPAMVQQSQSSSGSTTPSHANPTAPNQAPPGMPIHSPMLPPQGIQRPFSPYSVPLHQVDAHQMAIMNQQQRAMMHHQMQQQQAMHAHHSGGITPNAQQPPTTPTSVGGYYGMTQPRTPMQPNTPQGQNLPMQPGTPMGHMGYPTSVANQPPGYPPQPGGMPPNQMMQARIGAYPPNAMPPQGQPPGGFRPMPPAEESTQPPPKKKRKPTKKQLKEAEIAAAQQNAQQQQQQQQAAQQSQANQLPQQHYYGDRMMPGPMPGQFMPQGYPNGPPHPGYGPMHPHGMNPGGQPPGYPPGYPQGGAPHPQQQQIWQHPMQQRMMYQQQQGWMPTHGPPMQRGLPVPYPTSSQQMGESVPTPVSRPEYGDASCSSTPTTPHSGHGYPHSHMISPGHPGYTRSDSQNSFGYPPMPRDIPQQQTPQPQQLQQQNRSQSQNDFSNIPTQNESLDDLGDLDDIEPMNELSTSGSLLNTSNMHGDVGGVKNENGEAYESNMSQGMEGNLGMGPNAQLNRRPSGNPMEAAGGQMQHYTQNSQMDHRMMPMGMQQPGQQMPRNAQMLQRGDSGARLINGHEQPNGARRNAHTMDGSQNDEMFIRGIVKTVVEEEDKRKKEVEQKTKQPKKPRQPKKAAGGGDATKQAGGQHNNAQQPNAQNMQQAQMQQ